MAGDTGTLLLCLMKFLLPDAATALTPAGFYGNYYGHRLADLEYVLNGLRNATKPVVFLAGDSTLDNKYWLFNGANPALPSSYNQSQPWTAPAIGSYKAVLEPQIMVKDVAYWMSHAAMEHGYNFNTLNAAVEESMVEGRAANPKSNDVFVRDNIAKDDILIISVGGNDLALNPSVATQQALIGIFTDPANQAKYFAHLMSIFKDQMTAYAEYLVGKVRPRAILMCMLYYLDEKGEAWPAAEQVLQLLGYNANPAPVQNLIKQLYEQGVKAIQIEGVQVVPVPLFETLDGKTTTDYLSRVEPSVSGGEKIGAALASKVFSTTTTAPTMTTGVTTTASTTAVTTTSMQEATSASGSLRWCVLSSFVVALLHVQH